MQFAVGSTIKVEGQCGSVIKVGEHYLRIHFEDGSKKWVDPEDVGHASATKRRNIACANAARLKDVCTGKEGTTFAFPDGTAPCLAQHLSKRQRCLEVHEEVVKDANEKEKQGAKVYKTAVGRSGSLAQMVTPVSSKRLPLPPHRYVVAPMVGGSELAFRKLCRRYGADLCYSPMIYSQKFVEDVAYRKAALYADTDELLNYAAALEDAIMPSQSSNGLLAAAPLVAHFCGNNPQILLEAARIAEAAGVAAVDLNLGCPQRVAHSGHFGSYLLGHEDRKLVCNIVRTLAQGLTVPVFCKIRLLDTEDETLQLCRQLVEAGCQLIAVHARYRGTATRRREGPAHLDQLARLRQRLDGSVPLLSNGNVRSGEDVVANLAMTGCQGVMSAEGVLDVPTLFATAQALAAGALHTPVASTTNRTHMGASNHSLARKLQKKLRAIEGLEERSRPLNREEQAKMAQKEQIKKELSHLERAEQTVSTNKHPSCGSRGGDLHNGNVSREGFPSKQPDALSLALEYLKLAEEFPLDAPIATVAFHLRRMARDALTRYQMLDDVSRIGATSSSSKKERTASMQNLKNLVLQCVSFENGSVKFVFDAAKAAEEKKQVEGKKKELAARKKFEDRMVRKARREGKDDLFYLRGDMLPTLSDVATVKAVSDRAGRKAKWKARFATFCFDFCVLGKCRFDGSGELCPFKHVTVGSQIDVGAAQSHTPEGMPSWLAENT